MGAYFARLRNRSLAVRATFLLAAVVVLYVMVLPAALVCGGDGGLRASGFAALACLVGAEIALVVSRLLRAPQQALWALLLGMTARMGVPLIFGLVVQLTGGPLAEAGLLFYLLVFFPVILAVETTLSLPQTKSAQRCTKPSRVFVSK